MNLHSGRALVAALRCYLLVFVALGAMRAAEPVMKPIFNGRDLTGWTVLPTPNIHWRVERGVLVGTNDEKLTGSMIWTEKSYRDFVLELDGRWQGPEIDTGVRIRREPSLEMQVGVSRSLKVDMTGSFLTDGQGHPTRYPEAGRAKEWQKYYRVGEWNTYRIEARGTTFTIAINGHEVAPFHRRSLRAAFADRSPVSRCAQDAAGVPQYPARRALRVRGFDAPVAARFLRAAIAIAVVAIASC